MGKKARVVSMACWELFEEQGQAYKDSVLPPAVVNRVSVEAGSSFGWARCVGSGGVCGGVRAWVRGCTGVGARGWAWGCVWVGVWVWDEGEGVG